MTVSFLPFALEPISHLEIDSAGSGCQTKNIFVAVHVKRTNECNPHIIRSVESNPRHKTRTNPHFTLATLFHL